MDDRLNSKPIIFDHPEKLTQGVSLEKDDVVAKTFINEEDGCVKCNIVLENKVTGETAKRDEVIGEIVEDENEDEEFD
ncbi:hypothetical protein K2F40_07185 [Clostridium sp. CM028]|uniref:hypothetical protein n=1 Tax=unclassified Clostridium TaxID=2614128 RepID=UPI001C0E8A84|nr:MULTISPECIES: hypothetical protein [unclassified Clostridium]MBU3091773.1 hypothetical protein [Clostridium sp. CF011]MBW9145441.1 hypothetical protein [Clostridium sp. CM027]MBW9148741.1 hypothetical protein [Clostridium sp. CM028]UVE39420.1 hypothetical protein KTC92_09145 [Clostridium sp. CM027]WAG68325.1 hypothetical protein LL036_09400 [Clostridium sp. CF011]